jgi:hypothetical protein
LQATPHTPEEHVGAPFARTGHTVPQPPQLVGLTSLSTQVSPQRVVPAGHAGAQVPPTHTLPDAHTLPQAPQFAESLVVSTQALPQRANPVAQV